MASSNGSKWGESTCLGDKKARVVLLVSRKKDNKNVTSFQARRKAFLTTNTTEELENTFRDFVRKGVPGEKCRMYLSNNERDMRAVKKELIKHLIDNDDFNLCAIDTKIAAIAATKQCAKEKKWFFDFDIDNEKSVYRFIQDIYEIDPLLEVTLTRTVNGYAVGTSRGFDTRKLFEKWDAKGVTLKRDDLLLEAVAENIEPVTITRCVHESVLKSSDPHIVIRTRKENKNQTKIPMELLILNDLLHRKAIDEELYSKAVQKIMTAQKEKVKVKLTLEMNVEEALAAFECETVEDVVDCTIQELSDLFTGTYSGLTITESEIIKTGDKSSV